MDVGDGESVGVNNACCVASATDVCLTVSGRSRDNVLVGRTSVELGNAVLFSNVGRISWFPSSLIQELSMIKDKNRKRQAMINGILNILRIFRNPPISTRMSSTCH